MFHPLEIKLGVWAALEKNSQLSDLFLPFVPFFLRDSLCDRAIFCGESCSCPCTCLFCWGLSLLGASCIPRCGSLDAICLEILQVKSLSRSRVINKGEHASSNIVDVTIPLHHSQKSKVEGFVSWKVQPCLIPTQRIILVLSVSTCEFLSPAVKTS
jgi:hypothetical protein